MGLTLAMYVSAQVRIYNANICFIILMQIKDYVQYFFELRVPLEWEHSFWKEINIFSKFKCIDSYILLHAVSILCENSCVTEITWTCRLIIKVLFM